MRLLKVLYWMGKILKALLWSLIHRNYASHLKDFSFTIDTIPESKLYKLLYLSLLHENLLCHMLYSN